eukprot:scaffold542227_cov29-Prasinocladus_malaysianus.AAC.1
MVRVIVPPGEGEVPPTSGSRLRVRYEYRCCAADFKPISAATKGRPPYEYAVDTNVPVLALL